MKIFYRRFIALLFLIIEKINISKVFLFEMIAIYSKRKLYNNIIWTPHQQKKFDDYWLEVYGKKISNRWHKLYQSINGEFNVAYLPEWFYTVKIEPTLNPFLKSKILEDKSLCELILSDSSHIYSFPKTLLMRDGDIFYDAYRNVIHKDEIVRLLSKTCSAIIKPTVGGSSGNGVQLLSGSDLIQTITNNSAYRQAIIQEKIQQSNCLSVLNPSSINTFRVITYITNGQIYHAPLSLRIGGGESILDNVHAGGMVIHVKDNGELERYAYRLGCGDSQEKFSSHPQTDVIFESHFIPNIDAVINAAYVAHKKLPGIGIVSWDITLDVMNVPIIIEANLLGQSTWFPQVVSGKSLFGNNTKLMLETLKK